MVAFFVATTQEPAFLEKWRLVNFVFVTSAKYDQNLRSQFIEILNFFFFYCLMASTPKFSIIKTKQKMAKRFEI